MTSGNELIIVGGGLAGCIAALVLTKLRPEVPIYLVEGAGHFGGNHIWSFFDTDMPAEARWLVEPLIGARWRSHDVSFPERRRTLANGYSSIFSERLDAHVRNTLGATRYMIGDPVAAVEPGRVVLASGTVLRGRGVIDARGEPDLSRLDNAWQKFKGQVFELDRPHGLERPVVMDATVEQRDGYRFVYCLPFSPTRLLVEDTYYTLNGAIDHAEIDGRIARYMAEHGWSGAVSRTEAGALPVVLAGSAAALWRFDPGVAKIGVRGGFFHPTTGYSLADAVRIAYLLARQSDFSSHALERLLWGAAQRLWRQRGFYRLLNRMLFRAARPDERYRVFQHFYRLAPEVIARFYAGRSLAGDKIRILSGKPPVPLSRALRAALS